MAKAQAGGNDGRTWEESGKGSRLRAVSGGSQELALMPGEWVTESRRSQAVRSRLGGDEVSFVRSEPGVYTEMSLSVT